jgi:acyl-coenzyme A synthetase/AMP-(fatty) acid ligase
VAFITERNEVEPGSLRHPNTYTYKEALDEVSRLSNALKVVDAWHGWRLCSTGLCA